MDGAIRFWVLGGISVSVITQLQKSVLQSFHYGNGDGGAESSWIKDKGDTERDVRCSHSGNLMTVVKITLSNFCIILEEMFLM